MKKNESPHDLFWARVSKPAGEEGCWGWIRPRGGCGKPLWPRLDGSGRIVMVRVVIRAFFGLPEVPFAYKIVATCGNAECLNPKHGEVVPRARRRVAPVSKSKKVSAFNDVFAWISETVRKSSMGASILAKELNVTVTVIHQVRSRLRLGEGLGLGRLRIE